MSTPSPIPTVAASPLLQVNGLKSFRGDRLLFESLSFAIEEGEVVQIHGPNGSGKTTLLRILCGLTPPTEGELRWRGEPVAPAAAALRAEIEYVGHAGGVKLDLTARENLEVARGLAAFDGRIDIDGALERLGVSAFHDSLARTLSAGQRRRIALARLLVRSARLWILDEPFTALDADGVGTVDALLAEHVAEGGSAILTSHHPVVLGTVHPRLFDIRGARE